ncbi:MAG: FAD-dependent oxidoreductase [Planctomycetota bacterium]
MTNRRSPDVAVVGAGALGGWTALQLLRAGCRVTLVDAWGPGHARASSGGETRVIRRGYGPRDHYVPYVSRALDMWRELEAETGARLFDPRGVLWLVSGEGAFEEESMDSVRRAGAPVERLDPGEVARRYPAMETSDLAWAFLEPDAGTLYARAGCEAVWNAVAAAGGDVRIADARPAPIVAGRCTGLELGDGSRLDADVIAFAAGPWLPSLFPELLRGALTVTRQEVFSFGVPAGDRDHLGLPVWAEYGSPLFGGETFWYGIPGGLSRGFKLGEDTHGPEFDPTDGDRRPDAERYGRARAYLAHRFPALANAPLVDARVCQYTMREDGEILLDRHPDASNLWLLGAGSGHGYKLGPSFGDLAARAILEDEDAVERAARFALASQS